MTHLPPYRLSWDTSGSSILDESVIVVNTVSNTSWIDVRNNIYGIRDSSLYRHPPNLDWNELQRDISNWNELQMGEEIQQRILDGVERGAVSNPSLNPGGDSAIRKLL